MNKANVIAGIWALITIVVLSFSVVSAQYSACEVYGESFCDKPTVINNINQTVTGGGGSTIVVGDGQYINTNSTGNTTQVNFNETKAGEELAVNSSDNWDGLDTINGTQMENNGGTLNILESWLTSFVNSFGPFGDFFFANFSSSFDANFSAKTTDDLTEGSTNHYNNDSFNQSLTDGKYHPLNNGTFDDNLTAIGGYLCVAGTCYYIPDLNITGIQDYTNIALTNQSNSFNGNISAKGFSWYNGAVGTNWSTTNLNVFTLPYQDCTATFGLKLCVQAGLYLHDKNSNVSYLYFPSDDALSNWVIAHDRSGTNLTIDYTGTGGYVNIAETVYFFGGLLSSAYTGPTGTLMQIDASNANSYLIVNGTNLDSHHHNSTSGEGGIIPHERNITHPCNYDTAFTNYHDRPIIIRTTAELSVNAVGDQAYITALVNNSNVDVGDTGWNSASPNVDGEFQGSYDHLTFNVQPGENYTIQTKVGGSGSVSCKHIIKELF